MTIKEIDSMDYVLHSGQKLIFVVSKSEKEGMKGAACGALDIPSSSVHGHQCLKSAFSDLHSCWNRW